MASRKRRMYCLGEMMVGSLPPARRPVLFTHVSSCLSHVNWSTLSARLRADRAARSSIANSNSGAIVGTVHATSLHKLYRSDSQPTGEMTVLRMLCDVLAAEH